MKNRLALLDTCFPSTHLILRKGAPKSNQAGFTLIEVIMAMVVLSAAIIPLFTLFSTHLDAMRKMAGENEKAAATSQILNYMSAVNPATTPTGEMDFGSFKISWESNSALENAEKKQAKSNFKVDLFDTAVTVLKAEDQDWFNVKLRLAGFKKLKAIEQTGRGPDLEDDQEEFIPRPPQPEKQKSNIGFSNEKE